MISVRKAELGDIDFITEGIVQAEKSGTEILGYSKIFQLSETKIKEIIQQILEEEIEGQEWYLPYFFIAEIDGQRAGSLCAWVENSGGHPGSLIKAQAMAYFLGEKWHNNSENIGLISRINIPRAAGQIQLECIYTHPNYRKMGVASALIEHAVNTLQETTGANTAAIQLMGNNHAALKAYEQCGFLEARRSEDLGDSVLHLLPGSFKIEVSKHLHG